MRKRFTLLLLFCVGYGYTQSDVLKIADSLYATGNYTQAINAYAGLGTTNAGIQIARAYNAIGNYEKSVTQYRSVLKADDKQQLAQFELGKLLLKTNKGAQAQDLFYVLAQENPSNPEYHYQLGEAMQEQNNLDKSIPHYKQATVADSTHLRSLFQLSKYYLVKREKDSVISYADQGLAFYSEDVSLLNLKALAYFNNEEFRKSIPFFEKLLALGERKTFLFMKLGMAYFKTWEFEKSKEMYAKALALEEDNAAAYFELGQVFLKDRQLDSAQVYVKKAIEVQIPYLAEEYETLASIERQKGNLKGAFDYYALAHKEDPDIPRLYWQICVLYNQMQENPSKKLVYYESFIQQYGTQQPYLSEMAQKRISELKEQIHYAKESTD